VSRPSFEFFEVVRVEPRPGSDPALEALRGRIGAVLGKGAEDGELPTSYAVAIDGLDEVWSIAPEDLVSTGQFRRYEDYYDGTSVRVSVDGELLE